MRYLFRLPPSLALLCRTTDILHVQLVGGNSGCRHRRKFLLTRIQSQIFGTSGTRTRRRRRRSGSSRRKGAFSARGLRLEAIHFGADSRFRRRGHGRRGGRLVFRPCRTSPSIHRAERQTEGRSRRPWTSPSPPRRRFVCFRQHQNIVIA